MNEQEYNLDKLTNFLALVFVIFSLYLLWSVFEIKNQAEVIREQAVIIKGLQESIDRECR